jgi:hypothetical protein
VAASIHVFDVTLEYFDSDTSPFWQETTLAVHATRADIAEEMALDLGAETIPWEEVRVIHVERRD